VRPITVSVETPFSAPAVAPMLKAGKTVLRFNRGPVRMALQVHRYIAQMENICFDPASPGVLARAEKMIVVPTALPGGFSTAVHGFGRTLENLPDGRRVIDHGWPAELIEQPVIAPYFSQGTGIFLLNAMLSIYRARALLGSPLQVLVPEALGAVRRSYLNLIGVDDSAMRPVPQGRVVALRRAIVPSSSLARDVSVGRGGYRTQVGAVVEPHDALELNRLLQTRFGGGRRKRIYISRADAGTRRVANEDAIWPVLERFGFQRILMSALSAQMVAESLASAEILVAAHGSNSVYALFAPAGIPVLEFDHPRNDWVTLGVTRALTQIHRFIGAVPPEKRDRGCNDPFFVDPVELAATLSDVLGETPAPDHG
jgi:hypothetical protein